MKQLQQEVARLEGDLKMLPTWGDIEHDLKRIDEVCASGPHPTVVSFVSCFTTPSPPTVEFSTVQYSTVQ